MQYPTIQSAARGLLGEVVNAIGARQKYVVVGGWSPYLLNNGPIPHPGTKDVDLLFLNGDRENELKSVVGHLRSQGFLPSAKHEFQLLRILNVRGVEFVFNVDLLHPGPLQANTVDFVKHLELPVPLNEFRNDRYTSKSIGVPGAKFLFDGFIDFLPCQFELPNGDSPQLAVPVMREVGTIVTKSGTVLMKKRARDSFDVFVATTQVRDRKALLNDFKRLKSDYADEFDTMGVYRELCESQAKSRDFALRVRAISPADFSPDVSQSDETIISPIRELLHDIYIS